MHAGRARAIAVSVAAILMTGASGAAARDERAGASSRPSLTGPITGGTHGFPQTATPFDLDASGFTESEFFLEGRATSYRSAGALGEDGLWDVEPAATASYRTRILVRRPTDAKDFNGTVIVEWLNVTSQVDVDVDFGFEAEELLRGGYAWVGVSAQEIAITSTGGGQFGPGALGLKAWDPERYGTLEHPGDAFSYDIFTQAGEAIRAPKGAKPLRGLHVEHVIADGESQSAFRMATYVNAVHPIADVYDGFLIHSRSSSAARLSDGPDGEVPSIVRIRTDLDAPVLQVLSETDLFALSDDSPFPDARQPDTASLRTWEIAGTAHSDVSYLRGLYEQGMKQFPDFLDLRGAFLIANDGPQQYVMRAAIRHLRDWIARDRPPPHAEPLEVADGAIVRDEHGNARGGIRTPPVDVPIATLTGEGTPLIGGTTPFPPAVLAELYPTHDVYVKAFRRAARRAVAAGFLLQEDADELVSAAKASTGAS